MRKFLSIIFVFVVLVVAVSFANAQTREKFEKRYGAPITQSEDVLEFYVRKNIILKITYEEKNEIKEFLVFPDNSNHGFSGELADELKEELFPAEKRIGKSWAMSFNTGGGGIYGETYRNVRILTQDSVYLQGIVRITFEFSKFPEGVKLVTE